MAPTLVEQLERFKVIYVQNMTTNPPSVVVCHFRLPGRIKPLVLKIPPSAYPQKIYPGKLPETAIRESSEELVGMIEMGVVKCVPPKRAREILRDPDVREEQKALFSRVNSDVSQRRWARQVKRAADVMPGQEVDAPVPGMHDAQGMVSGPSAAPHPSMLPQNPLQQAMTNWQQGVTAAPSRAQHQLAVAGVDQDVHPKVLGMMASFMPEMDNQTLRQLKAIKSQLSLADLNLIQQRAGMGSACGMWASKQLQSKARAAAGAPQQPAVPGLTG
jgi:hypothetical protein